MELPQIVQECQKNIPEYIFEYLANRGIGKETAKKYELGYGTFYHRNWIVIPIRAADGSYLFLKLRRDPKDELNQNKFMFYPTGSDATIYGWETMLKASELFICEGEFDRILLMERGIPAITTTAGAGTFKEDWVGVLNDFKKLTIIYDRDKAGDSGANKLAQKILARHDMVDVYKVTLPDEVGDGGDITDYFIKHNGNVDDLFSKYCSKVKKEIKVERGPAREYSQSSGGGINQEDIDNAKRVNCKDFLSVEKETYEGLAYALCPFPEHKEKTASFCCYPGDRGFYCYGCGQSGDAIDLVMLLHGCSFPDAVKFIINK